MQETIVNIIKEEPFIEDGLSYIKVTNEILTPRRTYLKGTVSGKYRGDKIPDDSDKSDLFDFEIYEAEVVCNSIDDFQKNKPFEFPKDFKNGTNQSSIKGSIFPKQKLPATLPVVISANNKTFGINVLEPQLFEFVINRKYHQVDGEQVYGLFNAFVAGYVLDYEREEVEEIVGPITETTIKEEKLLISIPCECSKVETGKTEIKGDYIRKEFKCKNHNDNVWGKWNYSLKNTMNTSGVGCLSEIIFGLGILLFIAFLIAILPGFLYFIGFFIAIFIISLIAPYLKWIFRVLGIILLIIFFGSLFKTCTNNPSHFNPPIIIPDTPREINPIVEPPIVDSSNTIANDTVSKQINDSIITRYRVWKDYDGNRYEGKYQIKLSSFYKAHYFKNNLYLSEASVNSYDRVVYKLKENDKNYLNGVYKLFDSIRKANDLNHIKFAKMIVSFVQDIPYAIVLEEACDSKLYNDSFTRDYLLSGKGDCDPYERFGINTPIEFLVNLKGDCDTRTLLLYTLLSHYDYDVAMMSSEFYGHSIIGINLPLNGTAYTFNIQRYVLWETTSPNAKPGIISNEISNLNNWRISLKSK